MHSLSTKKTNNNNNNINYKRIYVPGSNISLVNYNLLHKYNIPIIKINEGKFCLVGDVIKLIHDNVQSRSFQLHKLK